MNAIKPDINSGNKISIYPNPASGYINISSTEKISSIEITDLLGKILIMQNSTQTAIYKIDINNLKQGNGDEESTEDKDNTVTGYGNEGGVKYETDLDA